MMTYSATTPVASSKECSWQPIDRSPKTKSSETPSVRGPYGTSTGVHATIDSGPTTKPPAT